MSEKMIHEKTLKIRNPKTGAYDYEIEITNLDKIKRPVAAVADNVEVRDILSLKIKINKNIKIKLLHDKDKSLFKKIKIEQLRKNIR